MKLICTGLVFAVLACAQITPATVDAGAPGDYGFTGGGTTSIAPTAGVQDTTFRFGNFSYDMMVDPGPALVTFTWLEQTVGGPNQRKFRVTINDQVYFDQLDLYVACGFMHECTRTVLVISTVPTLHITFTTQLRNAIVSRITVAPALVLTSVKNCIAMAGPANCANLRLAAGVGSPSNMFIMLPATPEAIAAMVWR